MLKTKLAAAVLVALSIGPSAAFAQGMSGQNDPAQQDTTQSANTDASQATKARKLETITVTGSLIPQTQVETATPIVTITAEDMKARGFTTVADALQQGSFATGTVQGAQTSASFTQGAQTLSMFGLPVGFTKYLIDGRPMGNFPGLYNGSDAFNNISGIPMDMVDHIDILPGGQSSLYGSDAIAGVINIVLKKHIDAPSVNVRYGWYKDGGGADRRISFADSFSFGKFTSLVGVQFESSQPIWGFDRGITSHFFDKNPDSPPVASRDFLVYNPATGAYYFEDPNNCSNTTSLFGGSEGLRTRSGGRTYCGSFNTPGYRTLKNSDKTANLYTHNTFDVNDNLQLYGDLLYNYEEQKYSVGSNYTFWSTADWGRYYDPNIGDLVGLQRAFAPEDLGGYQHTMNKQYEKSYMLTLGGNGTFGDSNWDYDLGFTHSDDKLKARNWNRLAGAMDDYFQSHVLGEQQGLDPIYSYYPVFTPDYAAFYQPISPSDMAAMTTYTNTEGKTWDNMLRGQLTNASLFSLPGGDAGVAVVLEGGNQGWAYTPDPRLLNGEIWGTTDVQGGGHRTRYAATTEFRLPLLSQVTMDVSGRYDSYKVSGETVHHKTYNLGLEYRPFDALLLRGRYGTAFKVPTLADEYQGLSGYYSFVPDYLNCARLGFGPDSIGDCPAPYDSTQYFGQQSGNTALQPITAKVWSYGFVFAPTGKLSVSVDYLHWDIDNEVNIQSADTLSRTEYLCDIGSIDPNSPSCQNAQSQIVRGQGGGGLLGLIQQIYTPKVNVSNEQVNAITADFNYIQGIGSFGQLAFAASYSDVLKHTRQDYPGDPSIDLLRHPYYSQDFKTKANASITWTKDKWTATIFANRYGSTPNYLAYANDDYNAEGAGRLGAWTLYNASVGFNPTKNLALSFSVSNLFNKMPPLDRSNPGTTGTPFFTDNYNVYGRAMYLEANYKFGQ
jgi:outer membrane receptor protein involved in Fe transport